MNHHFDDSAHNSNINILEPTAHSNIHDHHVHASVNAATHHDHDHTNHNIMAMFFHGGCTEVILFEWWKIDSTAGLILSCFFVFLLAAAYESIKWFRIYYQMCYTASNSNGMSRHHPVVTLNATSAGVEEALIRNAVTMSTPTVNNIVSHNGPSGLGTLSRDQVYVPTVVSSDEEASRSRVDFVRNSFQKSIHDYAMKCPGYMRAYEAFLYGLQLVIAYSLMLIAMTYNVYLFTAVVAGATVGHWLFAGLKCLFNSTTSPVTADLQSADRTDNFASDACH